MQSIPAVPPRHPSRAAGTAAARLSQRLAALALLALAACIALPGAGAARTPDPATDRAALQQVEQWFADTRSLKAEFVQVDDRGRTATGTVWLRRPGRVRFEYDPPVPLMIVADGLFVMFVDRELEQVDRLPLVRSPLSILTADKVDLSRDAEVRDISEEPGLIRLTVADPQAPDEGEVTLVFRDAPLSLREWVVRDPAGRETVVTLQNTEINPDLPNRLFVYTDPAPGSGRPLP